jgi:60 kDa SS-A/Ro ribonucleoprotein
VLALTKEVDSSFVAKTALYSRQRGLMKDMPALLAASLMVKDAGTGAMVFARVIDDAKMIRNFVQIIRSGVTGRKSLGTRPKRLITAWLDARSEAQLFRASIGQNPSLVDVIKLVHPKPLTPERRAFYGYLLGHSHDAALLPEIVRSYEEFKAGLTLEVPDVPFQMLTALSLTTKQWVAIACNASWQTTRMNLNTFARHGVFQVPQMVSTIASRLKDPLEIRKARAFPYQLLAAYQAAGEGVPHAITEALQDAMEIATANVPAIAGKVYVLVDVSGSMASPVTGQRGTATSKTRCIDAAALVAACILRNNPLAEVIPFEQKVLTDLKLNPRDSVMTNAQKLAAVGGGGTNCSAPLAWLNAKRATGDTLIFLSDNESWMDTARRNATAMDAEWRIYKQRNPQARLACLDFVPNATTQVASDHDILNIGGFSDAVFELLAQFAAGNAGRDHWVEEIDKLKLCA